MTHDEIQELLGAYALDAVEADEAEAIELHLRDCPRCRDEVAQHRDTATFLASTGAAAPADVWDGIASRLEASPPVLTMATARPPRRWPVVFPAAAAVVLVAAGVAWVVGGRSPNPTGRSAIDAAIVAAYSDPHSRTVRLSSADGRHHVDAVVGPDGRGYLVGGNLPALSSDRTYQLWGVVGDTKVSLGVIGQVARKAAFVARADALAALAITEEEAGGVSVSGRAPVVTGRLPD